MYMSYNYTEFGNKIKRIINSRDVVFIKDNQEFLLDSININDANKLITDLNKNIIPNYLKIKNVDIVSKLLYDNIKSNTNNSYWFFYEIIKSILTNENSSSYIDLLNVDILFNPLIIKISFKEMSMKKNEILQSIISECSLNPDEYSKKCENLNKNLNKNLKKNFNTSNTNIIMKQPCEDYIGTVKSKCMTQHQCKKLIICSTEELFVDNEENKAKFIQIIEECKNVLNIFYGCIAWKLYYKFRIIEKEYYLQKIKLETLPNPEQNNNGKIMEQRQKQINDYAKKMKETKIQSTPSFNNQVLSKIFEN